MIERPAETANHRGYRHSATAETDFEEEIVEHCLHHVTGDDAEKAYKRGEALRKRRIVMQAFADFATQPPNNKVTPMRANALSIWTGRHVIAHRADFPRRRPDRCA